MKILKFLLVTIIVLIVVGAIAVVILLKNFDVDRYKPQILEQAGAALGRPLDFSDMDLDVSLKDGISVNLKQLTIGEDPAFQSGDFLKVDQISLGVDIMSFLKSRKVQVSSVLIQSPRITIIKGKDGRMNIETIANKEAALRADNPGSASPTVTSTTTTSASPATLPLITIDSIKVSDGIIKLIDQSFDPAVSVELSQFEFNVEHFTLNEAFPFVAEGALLSELRNFRIDGKILVSPEKSQAQLKDVKLVSNLSQLSLDQLRQLPMLKGVPLPQVMEGKFQTTIRDLVAGPQGVGQMAVDVDLNQGRVVLNDISQGVSVDLSKIELKVTGFSLTEPFKFYFQTAAFSDQPAVFLEGTARLDQTAQSAELTNTDFSVDLSRFSLGKIKSSVASLKEVELPETLSGQLKVRISKAQVGAQGLAALSASGELTDGNIKLRQLLVPVSPIRAKFQATESRLTLDELTLNMGKGDLKATATVDDFLAAQNYSGQATLNKIDLAEVVDQKDKPVKAQGLVNGTVTFQGQGLNPDQLTKSMNGESTISVENGKLLGVNVLKLVLDSLEKLPDLKDIKQTLPDEYQQKLTASDTILEKVSLDSVIQNGAILIQPLEVNADGFIFRAPKGQIGFDQKYSFQGIFAFDATLSESMIQGLEYLKLLLDNEQQVTFPLMIDGKGSARPAITPDLDYILKTAVKNYGRDELKKLIQKALPQGEEEVQPNAEGQLVPKNSDAPKEKRPEEELIDGLLNTIFK